MNSRLRIKTTGKLGFGVKLRFGEKLSRDEWFHLDLPHEQEKVAEDRRKRLQQMARRLSEVGNHAEARSWLEEAAATPHERGFRGIEQKVESMCPAAVPSKPVMTFRKVVDLFTSGKLHEIYPDDVAFKSGKSLDQSRAWLAIYLPALGDKTFDAIGRDDIDAAKLLIPKDLKGSTRARYVRELRRVMMLAVDPLHLVEQTPRVSVPSGASDDLFTFLYPAEEEAVAGDAVIPFEVRFLYAFMVRNGTRISETLKLTWDHIDLEAGTIHIAKAWTKTKRARYWDLAPDVLEALRLRRDQMPNAKLVFVPPPGIKRMTRHYIWRRFLPDLEAVGLDRREIFNPDEGERKLRVHDLRASFVTLARALGMPDRWIMDRSGHESAAVLEEYDRGVRHARERDLGWFAPMDVALKMTDVAREASGQSWAKTPKVPRKVAQLTLHPGKPHSPPPPINPANLGGAAPPMAPEGPFGPAGFSTLGQRSPLAPEHLSELLDLAQKARRWHLVTALGEALEAAERVREQAHPKVTSLDAARRRKEER